MKVFLFLVYLVCDYIKPKEEALKLQKKNNSWNGMNKEILLPRIYLPYF